MKTAYIVVGSEDGNIGVFSNKKLAHDRAVKYITGGQIGMQHKPDLYDKDLISRLRYTTYAKACKQLRNEDSVTIELYNINSHTADIQVWDINLEL